MNRMQAIEFVESYQPADFEEIMFKSRMINFMKKHEDCFERSLSIGHMTASVWLLNKEEDKVLLMHHTKLDRWFQLGGHCDGDTDLLAVAIKEAQEESGINDIVPVTKDIFDIDIHIIPANSKEAEHAHYDVRFLLKVNSDEQIVQNRESKELRWIPKDIAQLPTENASIVRMFEKWEAL